MRCRSSLPSFSNSFPLCLPRLQLGQVTWPGQVTAFKRTLCQLGQLKVEVSRSRGLVDAQEGGAAHRTEGGDQLLTRVLNLRAQVKMLTPCCPLSPLLSRQPRPSGQHIMDGPNFLLEISEMICFGERGSSGVREAAPHSSLHSLHPSVNGSPSAGNS